MSRSRSPLKDRYSVTDDLKRSHDEKLIFDAGLFVAEWLQWFFWNCSDFEFWGLFMDFSGSMEISSDHWDSELIFGILFDFWRILLFWTRDVDFFVIFRIFLILFKTFLRLQVLWIFGFQWYFWYFQGCMGFTYTPDAAIRHPPSAPHAPYAPSALFCKIYFPTRHTRLSR